MSAETITCRNLQNGFLIRDWPLSDWNLHDDVYKAEWEVVADVVAPEAPEAESAAPEAPAEPEAPAA